MAELVSLTEARNHLRLDTGTADDAWLNVFIPAISEAVLNWLKDEWRAYVPEEDSSGVIVDSAGDPVPAEPLEARWSVKAAVLIELAWQYRYRDGDGEHTPTGDIYSGRYGYTLSKGATSLLSSLRKPTVG